MERHRAQLADQAIEEQLEVQTAFREQVCVFILGLADSIQGAAMFDFVLGLASIQMAAAYVTQSQCMLCCCMAEPPCPGLRYPPCMCY